MVAPGRFQNAIDVIEALPLDERRELLDVARRRLIEEERARITRDIEESRREFAEGKLEPKTVDEIMREIRG